MDAIFRTVHPYPTYAQSASMAGGQYLRDQWLTDRTRRVTRPLLAALRRGRSVGR